MSQPIKISKMYTAMMDDVVEVLKDYLDQELDDVCYDNGISREEFRIVMPEQFIRSLADIPNAFRRLNVDACACFISKVGSSTLDTRFSQSENYYNEVRSQTLGIEVVLREYDGAEMPEFNGRALLIEELQTLRAEMYCAAITNVMTKHAEGGKNNGIWQIYLDQTMSSFDNVDEFGLTAFAQVTFSCLTDVLIENKVQRT